MDPILYAIETGAESERPVPVELVPAFEPPPQELPAAA